MDTEQPAANSAPVSAPLQTLPSSWPGAFGLYKYSRNAVVLNIWTILGLGLLNFLGGVVIDSIFAHSSATKGIGSILSTLFSVLITTALTLVFIAGARTTVMDISQSLKKALPFFVNALLLSILTGFIAVISLALLIVPFFIVIPRLSLSMYFLLDKNLGPIDALKASWEATRGNVGKVWGIIGATIVMAILVLVIVGIYFLIMYSAAAAILYVYLTEKKATSPAETTAVDPTTPNTDAPAQA